MTISGGGSLKQRGDSLDGEVRQTACVLPFPIAAGQRTRLTDASDPIGPPAVHECQANDAIFHAVELTVASALGVPKTVFKAPTRMKAKCALARQVVFYLCHVIGGKTYTEIGGYFGRDRTTIRHACGLIEDLRDRPAFDAMICEMESILPLVRSRLDGQSFHDFNGVRGGEVRS